MIVKRGSLVYISVAAPFCAGCCKSWHSPCWWTTAGPPHRHRIPRTDYYS